MTGGLGEPGLVTYGHGHGGAVGAGLRGTVAAMLLDHIEAKRIETALPAWLESGKPDALPEFVQPPAEAETAP